MPPDTPAPCSVKLAPCCLASAASTAETSGLPMPLAHSPSPNLSFTSAAMASSAASASAPWVSTAIRLPRPAASIITPITLFAFTRRPFRDSHTSATNLAAVWVSFAAARACRPSLFWISITRCGMRLQLREVQHAFTATADRFRGHARERLGAIGERPDQHWQVHAGDDLDPAGLGAARRAVRRRGSEPVGQHQHAFDLVEVAHELLRLREDRVRVIVHGDTDLAHAQRTLPEDVARAVNQRLAERAVSDDQNADHDLRYCAGRESSQFTPETRSSGPPGGRGPGPKCWAAPARPPLAPRGTPRRR